MKFVDHTGVPVLVTDRHTTGRAPGRMSTNVVSWFVAMPEVDGLASPCTPCTTAVRIADAATSELENAGVAEPRVPRTLSSRIDAALANALISVGNVVTASLTPAKTIEFTSDPALTTEMLPALRTSAPFMDPTTL